MFKTRTRKGSSLNILVDLPTPINLSMWWNFGRLLGLILGIQILTGFFLSMHYTAHVDLAFSSVRHIVRDVNGGWLMRTLHANGASIFFLSLFAHVARGLYFGRYMYKGTWFTGVFMLFGVIASAFLGYVLPWGQIRFWGATVITNLLRAIPYIGDRLVTWLWGGFSVDNATLTRFYRFHFLMPLLVSACVLLHIILLHSTGSNNPLGLRSNADKVPFHCYFVIKDIVGFIVMFSLAISIVLFAPYLLGEPDNFIMANPLSTPAHIVPEWYFLFAYAILRSIPNKLGGVVGLFASLLFLLFLPFFSKMTIKSNSFYPLRKALHWRFVLSFLMLTIGGSWPVELPYVETSKFFTIRYFSFFVLFLPLRIRLDKIMY